MARSDHEIHRAKRPMSTDQFVARLNADKVSRNLVRNWQPLTFTLVNQRWGATVALDQWVVFFSLRPPLRHGTSKVKLVQELPGCRQPLKFWELLDAGLRCGYLFTLPPTRKNCPRVLDNYAVFGPGDSLDERPTNVELLWKSEEVLSREDKRPLLTLFCNSRQSALLAVGNPKSQIDLYLL